MYHESFRMFAAYNQWANARLYAAAGRLSADEFAADRGVFFRSMQGTLNHILVADRLWMRRFTGNGDAPDRLDAILFPGLGDLQAAREAEDRRIVHWIDSLDEEAIGGRFTYRTVVNPAEITQRLGAAMSHLFNHQTHHRGQAHAILSGFAREAPSMDLIYFQRETGIGIG